MQTKQQKQLNLGFGLFWFKSEQMEKSEIGKKSISLWKRGLLV